jgi:cytochrome c556
MKRISLASAICISLGVALGAVQAQTVPPSATALQLRSIMKEMGRASEQVASGIANEDWPAVAHHAQALAEHPEPPPQEKVRILTLLGPDAGRFRDFDRQSAKAAMEMRVAAQTNNGQNVIDSFAKVQSACLGCHQTFRSNFKQHFYPER